MVNTHTSSKKMKKSIITTRKSNAYITQKRLVEIVLKSGMIRNKIFTPISLDGNEFERSLDEENVVCDTRRHAHSHT